MGTYPFTKRRFARALAAEVVYRHRLLGEPPKEALAEILRREELSDEEKDLLSRIIKAYVSQGKDIERLVEKKSEHWRPERMLFVDRAIIEAAVAELLLKETSFKVIITEALEIAKALSTERSVAFINGLLDGIAKELMQT